MYTANENFKFTPRIPKIHALAYETKIKFILNLKKRLCREGLGLYQEVIIQQKKKNTYLESSKNSYF